MGGRPRSLVPVRPLLGRDVLSTASAREVVMKGVEREDDDRRQLVLEILPDEEGQERLPEA